MAVLVCMGTALRLTNFRNVNTRTPDERVYTYQAKTWLESGKAGIRSMVDEYNGDAETRWYPPPTRVGMIRLVAVVMRWTGRGDESVGARISCAASIASLLVMAIIGIRFLPRGLAAQRCFSTLSFRGASHRAPHLDRCAGGTRRTASDLARVRDRAGFEAAHLVSAICADR